MWASNSIINNDNLKNYFDKCSFLCLYNLIDIIHDIYYIGIKYCHYTFTRNAYYRKYVLIIIYVYVQVYQ